MSFQCWNTLCKLKQCLPDSNFAIMVLNQPITINTQLIRNLWKKAVLRSLADGGSNRWLEYIQKESGTDLPLPDLISGDFDSLLPTTKEYFEEKEVNFVHTPDQNDTDFTKALKCVKDIMEERKLHINEILVVCDCGGRLDQTLSIMNTLHHYSKFLPNVSVKILSGEIITWLLPSGSHTVLITDEFIEKKLNCGVIPLCGPTKISTKGLKWNLEDIICEFGGLVSTSNTYTANVVHIICDKAIIWTTEY